MDVEMTRVDFMHILEQQDIAESPHIPSIEERCHVVAKAAQQKLVLWLEENEDKGGFKEMFFVCIPRDIWQELRKAAGL